MKINITKIYRLIEERNRVSETAEYLALNNKESQVLFWKANEEELNAKITKAVEPLKKTLDEVQRRSRVRMADWLSISNAVKDLDGKLSISNSQKTGCRVDIDINAQKFPSAYKFTPESTIVALVHNGKGWIVEKIYRDRTMRHMYSLRLTDTAKEAILNNYVVFD